jgi:predicted dehydrogenase
MVKNNTSDRRDFIKKASLGIGVFYIIPSSVLGKRRIPPSDKITIGFIGTGKQSMGLGNRFLQEEAIQMIAACDVDKQKLERFQKMTNDFYASQAGNMNYKGCSVYLQYEDLLMHDDLDAVIIALPDHWHAPVSIHALEAGKDVYCEKPLAHTVKEGRDMVIATQKNDRILQTGSMQRSQYNFRHAVELVRNGYIGDIKTIKVNVGDPAIDCDLPDEETPGYLDWDRWLGPAPQRGYNSVLSPPITDDNWPNWRRYREFGGGSVSDWGAHMFDIVQWALDMDNSGPVKFLPPDEPLQRGLKMIYSNDIAVTHEDFERGWAVQFNGSEGKLEVSRSFIESEPESIATAEIKENDKRVHFSDNHYLDWIKAIKTRTKPICDAETGHRSSSVCNIANIAYLLRRPLTWDPVKEKFYKDKEADRLLKKKHRRPYVI